ncbi:MAG: hypothetical protein D6737_10800, partial [Chloroflexi bacterium]
MRRTHRGIPAFLWVIIVTTGFGVILWLNTQSNSDDTVPNGFIIPTEVSQVDNRNAWQEIVREGFGDNSTPLPTVELPAPESEFVPPTLDQSSDTGAIQLEPAQLNPQGPPTPFDAASPPTPLPPTQNPVDPETGVVVTVVAVTGTAIVWQPPPLEPPLSRDPLGRDHYWLRRPVDSNANNAELFYYPFGSDGPQQENPWRIHHGIDMPNPVGQTVRAAGSGTVVWAADGLRVEEDGFFQNTPSYGNVVLIEHDFGYRGQPLYTLYAHLSGVLVERGQQVNAGDAIGLVGQSGR